MYTAATVPLEQHGHTAPNDTTVLHGPSGVPGRSYPAALKPPCPWLNTLSQHVAHLGDHLPQGQGAPAQLQQCVVVQAFDVVVPDVLRRAQQGQAGREGIMSEGLGCDESRRGRAMPTGSQGCDGAEKGEA